MTIATLKKVRFDAAFPDGLLEMDGYAFECAGRTLVVHGPRPAYRHLVEDWKWLVSDKDTGFGLSAFADKTIGACMDKAERSLSAEALAKAVAAATEKRPTNRVIE